jgi:hypothetical protein
MYLPHNLKKWIKPETNLEHFILNVYVTEPLCLSITSEILCLCGFAIFLCKLFCLDSWKLLWSVDFGAYRHYLRTFSKSYGWFKIDYRLYRSCYLENSVIVDASNPAYPDNVWDFDTIVQSNKLYCLK